MPNWCSTQVTINGKTDEMNLLYKKMDEIEAKAKIETDFGSTWLGHILDHLGEWNHKTDEPSCGCRGYITFREKNDDEITLDIDSAWSPLLGPIVKLCKKYAPESELVFEAIEPGCGIYETNDPSVYGNYLVDIWNQDGLPEAFWDIAYEFYDEQDLKTLLAEALGHDSSLESLINEAREKWGDNLSINKMEWCALEEVCY